MNLSCPHDLCRCRDPGPTYLLCERDLKGGPSTYPCPDKEECGRPLPCVRRTTGGGRGS